MQSDLSYANYSPEEMSTNSSNITILDKSYQIDSLPFKFHQPQTIDEAQPIELPEIQKHQQEETNVQLDSEPEEIDQQQNAGQTGLWNRNELLTSKYVPNIIKEVDPYEELADESEHLDQVGQLMLQSINHQPNFFLQASLARFTCQQNNIQSNSMQGEIISIVYQNNVVYYEIESTSPWKGYKIKVKRRYNDFKLLLRELKQKHPLLIMPQIPCGNPYVKLAEKDLEERKRMLQNILNVLCCHEDIIKEKLFREFLEEESNQEFEIARQVRQSHQQHALVDLIYDQSKKSIKYLKKLITRNTQSEFNMVELDKEILSLKQQYKTYEEIQQSMQSILKKQILIKQNMVQQDRDQNLFYQELKLNGVQFDCFRKINFQSLSLENRIESFYNQCLSQINNILEFLNSVFAHYEQINESVEDLLQMSASVTPNQQISKQLKEDVQRYVDSAKLQINSKEGVVQTYLYRLKTNFEEKYIQFQEHIWNWELEKIPKNSVAVEASDV